MKIFKKPEVFLLSLLSFVLMTGCNENVVEIERRTELPSDQYKVEFKRSYYTNGFQIRDYQNGIYVIFWAKASNRADDISMFLLIRSDLEIVNFSAAGSFTTLYTRPKNMKPEAQQFQPLETEINTQGEGR